MALDSRYITTSDLEAYFVDKETGLPLAGGIVTFYSDVNRSDLKPIYTISGTAPDYSYVQLPNPTTLSGVGTFQDGVGNNIVAYYFPYDADGNVERYFIDVKSSTGTPQFTRPAWPNDVPQPADIIVSESEDNLVRNPQFTRWGNDQYLSSADNVVFQRLGTNEVIADDFIFERTNTNCTVKVSQINFLPGQTVVPGNPVSFLQYECTAVNSGGETFKAVSQTYQSAQFLSGQQVTIGFYGLSTTEESITVYVTQYFGTGGSPSADVVTQVATINLIDAWTHFSGTITVPSVVGKSFGTNGDDYFKISLGLPLNQISNISFANVQMCQSSVLPAFPAISIDNQTKFIDAVVTQAVFTTGDYKLSINNDLGKSWVKCDDGTIGNAFSNADHASNETFNLFKMIWNNINEIYIPIFDSSPFPARQRVPRGASYLEDWNNNRQLNLTKVLGRALGASGAVHGSMLFTADDTTDQLTVGYAGTFYTGNIVRLLSQGSLPSPLLESTDYYVIFIDNTHIQLANNSDEALAGTFIDITTTGSGLNTVLLFNGSNAELGRFRGEENHFNTAAELATHRHGIPTVTGSGADEGFVPNLSGALISPVLSGGNIGNQAHNNMMPILYTNCFFKL